MKTVQKQIDDYFNLIVKKCDLEYLSSEINFRIVEKNIDLCWSWERLSYNPTVTMDHIIKYIDKPWNWDLIAINKQKYNIHHLKAILSHGKIKFFKRPLEVDNISWEQIKDNRDYPWRWSKVYKKFSPDLCLVRENLDLPWDWMYMSIECSIELIGDNLDLPWIWRYVSENKNITDRFIQENIDKTWDWKKLSQNKELKILFSRDLSELDFHYLSQNVHLTSKYVEKNIARGWNWHWIFSHQNMDIDFLRKNYNEQYIYSILKNPNLDINFFRDIKDSIRYHNFDEDDMIDFSFTEKIETKNFTGWTGLELYWNITRKEIDKHREKIDFYVLSRIKSADFIGENLDLEWDWGEISSFHPIAFVLEYPDFPWDYKILSRKYDLSLGVIESKIECNWDWSEISKSTILTSHFIDKNIGKNWDWFYLSLNQRIETWLVLKHLDKPWVYNNMSTCVNDRLIKIRPDADWDWFKLTRYSKVSPELLYSILGDKLDWELLSRNRNLPARFVEKNLDKPWDWKSLSSRFCDNLYIDLYFRYPKMPWDWNSISYDPYIPLKKIALYPQLNWRWKEIFDKHSMETRIEIIREQILSCVKIQRWWRNIQVDERKKTGRRLVMQRFLEL